MKQGKWTRITAVLFAAAMLVSLSACGDTPPATGNPTTTTTAEETTTTTTETTTATTTATTTTTTTFIPQPIGELSSDMVKRIKDDWMAEHPVSDRPAERIELTYYGTYNDCVVLSLFDPALMYHSGVFDEEIDGVIFYGVSAYDMYIWHSGEFCLLREAYANGWISKEDLLNISYCWNDK